ncbi:outer membrane beta-barrel protein [Alteromonas halophila]|uniref:Outer membrane protein beta-barrel domain-containing protein n=1 Tax=Alteromonas halophila TaxID=516698 RepID=A0A918JL83_9ALTE|nr:outer membrane beta-barrel protein [Alteromonas halophila]GGW87144.1 hypothetical protein GCM10007391_21230 [Alteromonas halophila]
MNIKCFVAAASLLLSGQALATEKMYGTVGVGYSDSEFSEQSLDGTGYNLAVGHQFHPQWYVEAGYLQLLDDVSQDSGMETGALYLAILGKASSLQGELFYKLGIAKADINGSEAPSEAGECRLGGLQSGACRFDEGIVAGMVGLGYDYNIGMRSMLRFEYTYLAGEEDFSTHYVGIGFRYNFN